jgi:hypothetical protein
MLVEDYVDEAVKAALRLHIAHPYNKSIARQDEGAGGGRDREEGGHSEGSQAGEGGGAGGGGGQEEPGGGAGRGGGGGGVGNTVASGDFLIFMPGQEEVESTCFWMELQVLVAASEGISSSL